MNFLVIKKTETNHLAYPTALNAKMSQSNHYFFYGIGLFSKPLREKSMSSMTFELVLPVTEQKCMNDIVDEKKNHFETNLADIILIF